MLRVCFRVPPPAWLAGLFVHCGKSCPIVQHRPAHRRDEAADEAGDWQETVVRVCRAPHMNGGRPLWITMMLHFTSTNTTGSRPNITDREARPLI